MTLFVPHHLPAAETLRLEGFDVAEPGDRKPPQAALRVALLNLMPDKLATELQFARLLAASGMPVELVLLKPATHLCKTAPKAHMDAFYVTWAQAKDMGLHGLIVTGAPVETLPFAEVRYWDELSGIFKASRQMGLESLFICWAAQAALHCFHQVPKHQLPEKAFGVFLQQVLQFGSTYLNGMGTQFPCPVSRHTETRWADLVGNPNLQVLAGGQDAGLCLIEETDKGALYMFNHLEYDSETLTAEYLRDQAALGTEQPPVVDFTEDEYGDTKSWNEASATFFKNWLRAAVRRRMAGSFLDAAA